MPGQCRVREGTAAAASGGADSVHMLSCAFSRAFLPHMHDAEENKPCGVRSPKYGAELLKDGCVSQLRKNAGRDSGIFDAILVVLPPCLCFSASSVTKRRRSAVRINADGRVKNEKRFFTRPSDCTLPAEELCRSKAFFRSAVLCSAGKNYASPAEKAHGGAMASYGDAANRLRGFFRFVSVYRRCAASARHAGMPMCRNKSVQCAEKEKTACVLDCELF